MKFFRPRFIAFVAALQCTAFACKYNVRDVGFVYLEPVPYRLFGLVHAGVARETSEALENLASVSLLDSNVEFEKVNSRVQPDHEAMRYSRGESVDGLPELVLVAPDGRFLPIAIRDSTPSVSSAVWSSLESVVLSPFRDRLLRDIVQAFAVVVLVEGVDPGENERARLAAEGAARDLATVMDRFPKPVRMPPHVALVSRDALAKESIFLWSLGIDEAAPKEPVAAVLYGRGRRVGPLLRGEGITQPEIARMLGVLGQDCECDLDRAWMQGPLIPARWGGELQAEVLKEVGFDAENPMIKTEISRILARGPSSGARRVALPGIDGINFLGYKETALDDSVNETTRVKTEESTTLKHASAENEASAVAVAEPTLQEPILPEEESAEDSNSMIRIVVTCFVFLTIGGGLIVLWGRRPV
ncbi:MAG: hypothetical protein O2960_13115 [Verrucomicrobia bacterium]|nr:hypothetical protein [Verrucomicrobiota bacterium]